jgi:uncharacterized protein HemX
MSPASREEIQAAVEETRRQLDSRPPQHASGEHAVPEMRVSERTWFSWGVVVVVVGIAATVAVSLAKGQALAQQAARTDDVVQALRLKDAKNDADHARLTDLLERLEKKIDRIEQKLDAKAKP